MYQIGLYGALYPYQEQYDGITDAYAAAEEMVTKMQSVIAVFADGKVIAIATEAGLFSKVN